MASMLNYITKANTQLELKKIAANFKAEKAGFWKKGTNVPFTFLAIALEAISKESDTNVITNILCNMFRTIIETSPNEYFELVSGDLVSLMYILSESIYENERKISKRNFPMVGFHTLCSAVADSANCEADALDRELKALHNVNPEDDLSTLAKTLCKNIPYGVHKLSYEEELNLGWSLTVQEVYKLFKSFSLHYVYLQRSQNEISKVLTKSNAFEACYVIQLLSRIHQPGFHKINLDERTLLTSFAHAVYHSVDKCSFVSAFLDRNSLSQKAAEIVIKAYSILPFYEHLVPKLFRVGVWKILEECLVVPGISVRAMLPKQSVKSTLQIYDMFRGRDFICQFNYPGQRVLIHYLQDNKLSVYSMFGDWITETEKRLDQLPGVRSKVNSFILDCQLVEYKPPPPPPDEMTVQSENASATNPINDFWLINIMDMKKVCVVASDILSCNGESLVQKPLKARRKILKDSFEAKPPVFQFAKTLETPYYADIEGFLDEAVKSSCLGLIFKTLANDAFYEPGKINENWIELKKDYVEYVYPSLKLVPVAQVCHEDYRGDIAFLLACYDTDTDNFLVICTMGFEVPSSILKERIESLMYYQVEERKDNCDYLCPPTMKIQAMYEPTQVWEVTGEYLHEYFYNYTDSNIIQLCEYSEKIKGYKLECPRFVRVLDYEDVRHASSLYEVKEICETSTKTYETKRKINSKKFYQGNI